MSETETTESPNTDRLIAILDKFADRVESVRLETAIGDRRIEETVYLRAPLTSQPD